MYIVLASNSSHQVSALGTPKGGKPFASEAAAERYIKRLQQHHSANLHYLVLPLTAWEV